MTNAGVRRPGNEARCKYGGEGLGDLGTCGCVDTQGGAKPQNFGPILASFPGPIRMGPGNEARPVPGVMNNERY